MKRSKSKYQTIYDEIEAGIRTGEYKPGDQLPTEMELVAHYKVSRPTVNKALSMLQQDGLVRRRSGAGSFVGPAHTPLRSEELGVQDILGSAADEVYFGLLIPMLGITEIFEPICARIAQRSYEHNFHVLWGDSATHSGDGNTAADFERTCMRYIERGLNGVFFVPLELVPDSHATNQRIVSRLREAGIPVVMLDADYLKFPERSEFDLVGIDNIRVGYLAAQHFLEQGAKRVDFVHRPFSAHTVAARERGFRMALEDAGVDPRSEYSHPGDPSDAVFVRGLLKAGAREIVCANDETAAEFIHTAERVGFRVPSEYRILGFDDVKYARFARIPLTTFRQPCAEIGDLAVDTMLSRINRPQRPPLTLIAHAELVVRESSRIPMQSTKPSPKASLV